MYCSIEEVRKVGSNTTRYAISIVYTYWSNRSRCHRIVTGDFERAILCLLQHSAGYHQAIQYVFFHQVTTINNQLSTGSTKPPKLYNVRRLLVSLCKD